MHLTLETFALYCGGVLNDLSQAQTKIEGFSLDTRSLKPSQLFIAVKGNEVDGNQYVHQALEKGAVAVLSEEEGSGTRILVPNIIEALAKFGKAIRKGFNGPVIGITGSNGKTSTKEFTAAALGAKGKVLKNIGNQNSEYSSPLVWAHLEEDHWAAVIEMGMRGFGQIRHLANIAQPNVAIISVIGTAHSELVHNREGIFKAKSEILENLSSDGTAILWAEDTFFEDLKKKSPCKVLSFGWSEQADFRITGYKIINWEKALIRATLKEEVVEFEIPVIGRHQALNAVSALVAAHVAHVPLKDAAQALMKVELPPLRMEIRSYNGVTILLDSYNAAPESVIAALESLAEMPCLGNRYAVLGEMKELGDYTETGHRKIGAALTLCSPKHAVLYGPLMVHSKEEAILTGYHPSSISVVFSLDKVHEFLNTLNPGDIVLMKASRSIGLEQALT